VIFTVLAFRTSTTDGRVLGRYWPSPFHTAWALRDMRSRKRLSVVFGAKRSLVGRSCGAHFMSSRPKLMQPPANPAAADVRRAIRL
jgi:hypothetical protein